MIVTLKTNVGDVLSAHLHDVLDVLQGWRPYGKRRACRTCEHMRGAHGKEGEPGNRPSKCHDDSKEIHSGHLVVDSTPKLLFPREIMISGQRGSRHCKFSILFEQINYSNRVTLILAVQYSHPTS